MKTYCDTSFLLKLYIREPDSSVAINKINPTQPNYLHFLRFQQLELHSAITGKFCRSEITRTEMEESLKVIAKHQKEGFLRTGKKDWDSIFDQVTALVQSVQTKGFGIRTMDVVHVATAMELEVDHFFTFDHRQAVVAQKVGLVTNLKTG